MAPLSVSVVGEPWVRCSWPMLAAVAGFLATVVVARGYTSPARFPSRLGVFLSPEEDMDEGFFHPIRAQRGSRHGFYRDARIFIRSDYQLSSQPRGALACLRAERNRVRLRCVSGTLWRLNSDEVWERLPPGETIARFGVIYRDDLGTIFFEIRNG